MCDYYILIVLFRSHLGSISQKVLMSLKEFLTLLPVSCVQYCVDETFFFRELKETWGICQQVTW